MVKHWNTHGHELVYEMVKHWNTHGHELVYEMVKHWNTHGHELVYEMVKHWNTHGHELVYEMVKHWNTHGHELVYEMVKHWNTHGHELVYEMVKHWKPLARSTVYKVQMYFLLKCNERLLRVVCTYWPWIQVGVPSSKQKTHACHLKKFINVLNLSNLVSAIPVCQMETPLFGAAAPVHCSRNMQGTKWFGTQCSATASVWLNDHITLSALSDTQES